MRVMNKQVISDICQRPIGGIEEGVSTCVVLRSDPLSLHHSPKCFSNVQMWRIRWEEEKEKSSPAEITLPEEGWYPTMAGLPSVFAEYNTMDANGHPIDLSKRINRYYRVGEDNDTTWCTAKNVLTDEEAALYTVEAVMGGDDHWQPRLIFQTPAQPLGYVVIDDRRIAVNRWGCFER